MPLTQELGFQVAAAITAYDGSPDIIEDPEIGSIKMYIKYWGVFEGSEGAIGGDGTFDFKEIKTKLCEKNDFNNVEGTNEKTKFYRTDAESE